MRVEKLDKTVLPNSFVDAYTVLRAGQEFGDEAGLSAAVAQDIDTLTRSERFTYVRAYTEKEADRLIVVYSVAPRLRLREITITGAKKLSARKVRNELGLSLGDLVDQALIGEKTRLIETFYRQKK